MALLDEIWRQPPGDVEDHMFRVVREPRLFVHMVMHFWTMNLTVEISANQEEIHLLRIANIQNNHTARNSIFPISP